MEATDGGSEVELRRAAEILRSGGLVAFPTETVYGLGADATDPAAVRRIYEAKGRPPGHPLIVHLASARELEVWSSGVGEGASRLARRLWPGPLTLVVPRGPGLADEVTGGRPTVGLRVPDHPVARELIDRAGVPVAAPSANRFGRVSPTTAADVVAELGERVDVVLDGGPCRVGLESTIVELVGAEPVLLRPGGVPVELVEEVLGRPVRRSDVGPARASGMLASHYAPGARVELVAGAELVDRVRSAVAAGIRVAVLPATAASVADLGIAPPAHPVGGPADVLVMDPPVDPDDHARLLYRRLRDADEAGVDLIVAERPDTSGIGAAVADRLAKAAAPRPAHDRG